MAIADPIKSANPPRYTKRCVDLTGKTFGRLLVASWGGRNFRGETLWNCVCQNDGVKVLVPVSCLKSGATRSCGCLIRETTKARATTHGMTNSAEYRVWCHMIGRCHNQGDKSYNYYGDRGISVCEEWRHSFEKFFADMGRRPSPKHSIERCNCDGDYCPSNCVWATASEQARNKSGFIRITSSGETLTVTGWSERLGINRATMKWRVSQGLTVDEILFKGRLPKLKH